MATIFAGKYFNIFNRRGKNSNDCNFSFVTVIILFYKVLKAKLLYFCRVKNTQYAKTAY